MRKQFALKLDKEKLKGYDIILVLKKEEVEDE